MKNYPDDGGPPIRRKSLSILIKNIGRYLRRRPVYQTNRGIVSGPDGKHRVEWRLAQPSDTIDWWAP